MSVTDQNVSALPASEAAGEAALAHTVGNTRARRYHLVDGHA